MTVEEQITEDMKTAMREKQEIALRTLRSLRAAFKNESIAKGEGGPLDDQMAIAVITREAKKRRDSIEQFHEGGREDLAKNEEAELQIIEKYLPEQLSEEDIRSAIQEIVDAEEEPEFGAVMKAAMEKMRGQADGAIVSKLVKDILNQ